MGFKVLGYTHTHFLLKTQAKPRKVASTCVTSRRQTAHIYRYPGTAHVTFVIWVSFVRRHDVEAFRLQCRQPEISGYYYQGLKFYSSTDKKKLYITAFQ
jgi:hypothetical protein